MMTDEQLKAIKERCERATKGPWYAEDSNESGWPTDKWPSENWTVSPEKGAAGWETDSGHQGYSISKVNAEFMAHSREDVPILLAEVERLRVFFGVIPDFDSLKRVADLAECGDENGRYHYVAKWLRALAESGK